MDSTGVERMLESLQACLFLTQSSCKVSEPFESEFEGAYPETARRGDERSFSRMGSFSRRTALLCGRRISGARIPDSCYRADFHIALARSQ